MKGCFWAVVAIAVIGVGGAVVLLGGGGPTQCPNLEGSPVTTLKLNTDLRVQIQLAIEDRLIDSGSYDYERTRANRRNFRQRPDGSRYYSSVVVSYTAKNAFGGRVSGAAEVDLDEDAEGACAIVGVELF